MYPIVLFFLCVMWVDISALDKVDIIAPSSKGKKQNLILIKKYIEKLNLKAHISEKIYSNNNLFYSNSDKFRADDLINALIDDSRIIWCIRGGKGASRLIPYLEKLPDSQKKKIAQNKKIFIGYSDNTVLHLYLQMKFDWQTIHGTTLEQIVNEKVDQGSVDKLTALILGTQHSIKLNNLKLINNQLKSQSLKSKIIGGNMTLVENSIGTTWQVDAKSKILFLEDVGVYPYEMERSLDHMKQANILDKVDAVIFGDFTKSDNSALTEIVKKRFAQSVDFPVFTISGIGHGYVNDPLPLNCRTVIKVEKPEEGLFSMEINFHNSA
ncbi:LD-carboxypeptidase [Wolbachia pipientis]|uniref:LD-carboxypeptidase n=1 Tax=Wolbachia pipientis TaxID=955 RepID=A0A1E7QK83_WOLPI|nr:LD-carboxypeptidase [Wolbachia pipientis]OEY86878.1 LD-carboxypeptidase [Wolbachia pipientis]